MFRIRHLDMIYWDFWQAVSVPLDAQIVTIIGPNGSGKTTLLDALRTLLALDCSGRRDYKRYVRNAKTPVAWLRGVVDNPKAEGLFPFPFWPLQTDTVTLFCRIKKQGGDWVRQYAMAEGDVTLTEEIDSTLNWMGVQEYRRRLEQAGLTPAIAKVLALEQGDTDKLCEYTPKALLELVFQVFGDKAVLDHYAEAKGEQAKVMHELSELGHAQTALENEVEAATSRANRYLEWRQLQDDVLALESEILPRIQFEALQDEVRDRWRDYRAPWQTWVEQRSREAELQQVLSQLNERNAQQTAAVRHAESAERDALMRFTELKAGAAKFDDALKLKARLEVLAREHPGAEALAEQVAEQKRAIHAVEKTLSRLKNERDDLSATHAALAQTGRLPLPADVAAFRRTLDGEGIAHDLLLDVIDVKDAAWQAAVEGVLRGNRYVILLKRPADRRRARELGQAERYKHFIVDECETVRAVRKGALLEVLSFSAAIPAWLVEQLSRITRVETVAEGETTSGDWITPDGFFKERRGARHIGLSARDYHFGHAVKQGRQDQVARELAALHQEITAQERALVPLKQALAPLLQLLEGISAAQQLAARAEEFAEATTVLAGLADALANAGGILATAQQLTGLERTALQALDHQIYDAKQRLAHAKQAVQQAQKQRADRRSALSQHLKLVRNKRAGMPETWLTASARAALRDEYRNETDVRARIAVERKRLSEGELRGEWITDESVLARRNRLQQILAARAAEIATLAGQVARAQALTEDARAAYINKLKNTVKHYTRNIKQLGQLAGIEVEIEIPHLENEDTVLAQAGLVVRFNFDQKGMMGLNDGEASGGQQVMKSLILLIGLMMNDAQPSGFVFIDEPFAHLDVFNIDRVGAFLKATQAQYLITSPNTHNINIFEPSDLTLTTRKKRPGEAFAPPLLQTRRRTPA